MKQYGLLGYPLSHSFSKGYFTEKFRKEGIDAVYENFALSSITELTELISSSSDLEGINVTIPYKESVMAFLDELDPEAEAVGAVNVIRLFHTPELRLVGYNSDVYGFRESIREWVAEMGAVGLKALILGTGGASKAIVHGLKQLGVESLLVSRKPAPGQISYKELTADHYRDYRMIVNTTPLGMYPNVDFCPSLDYTQLGPDHLLYDLTYNPEKTLFLQKGESQGATIKNGLEMLRLQAEASWEIWNT
ncbi:MAG TPA: shikimate dehydrogenase [Bacteroidales bacterium]|nr:shikimate dehydrogenase [Bacteroidales bacterium]